MVFTLTVLTLIIHVEVWVVGVYTHCTYTDHTSVVVDSVYCCVFTQGSQEFTSASVKVK